MFIQGNLQAVFDALYAVGMIDPVLKLDWAKITQEANQNHRVVNEAFRSINDCFGDRKKLEEKLHLLDPKIVQFIAVEVAREFAEFSTRSQLH